MDYLDTRRGNIILQFKKKATVNKKKNKKQKKKKKKQQKVGLLCSCTVSFI